MKVSQKQVYEMRYGDLFVGYRAHCSNVDRPAQIATESDTKVSVLLNRLYLVTLNGIRRRISKEGEREKCMAAY